LELEGKDGLPAPTIGAEALAAKAENPDALPIQDGTDVTVGLNFGVRRPVALLDLGPVRDARTL
jgi:hypothetical protein